MQAFTTTYKQPFREGSSQEALIKWISDRLTAKKQFGTEGQGRILGVLPNSSNLVIKNMTRENQKLTDL